MHGGGLLCAFLCHVVILFAMVSLTTGAGNQELELLAQEIGKLALSDDMVRSDEDGAGEPVDAEIPEAGGGYSLGALEETEFEMPLDHSDSETARNSGGESTESDEMSIESSED